MESVFNKVAGLQARNYIKKDTLTQVFSCEICEIFKYTYFEELIRTTASNLNTYLNFAIKHKFLQLRRLLFNLFQPSFALHIETSHLIGSAFCMKSNTD